MCHLSPSTLLCEYKNYLSTIFSTVQLFLKLLHLVYDTFCGVDNFYVHYVFPFFVKWVQLKDMRASNIPYLALWLYLKCLSFSCALLKELEWKIVIVKSSGFCSVTLVSASEKLKYLNQLAEKSVLAHWVWKTF